MVDRAAILDDVMAIRHLLDSASESLLTAAETGLTLSTSIDPEPEKLQILFGEIIQLCMFQDLAGQRLSRIASEISKDTSDTRPDADLLEGPANTDGLDQAHADRVFSQGQPLTGS